MCVCSYGFHFFRMENQSSQPSLSNGSLITGWPVIPSLLYITARAIQEQLHSQKVRKKFPPNTMMFLQRSIGNITLGSTYG